MILNIFYFSRLKLLKQKSKKLKNKQIRKHFQEHTTKISISVNFNRFNQAYKNVECYQSQ